MKLKSIEESAIVKDGIVELATTVIRDSVVLEWLESRDSKGNLIINQFCFPKGRDDLRSLISQKEYAPGTVWKCTIGCVCSERLAGNHIMRTVIIFDLNEQPVKIVRPHVGPWEIGQEIQVAVSKDSKNFERLILKPDNGDKYLSFFNLSPQDQEKLQTTSKPNDGWIVKIEGGGFGNTNHAGKRMLPLNCSLVGDLPVRRRVAGDYFTTDEIIVRVTTVNGIPEISGCIKWGRGVIFVIDREVKDQVDLLNKCTQGDRLIFTVSDATIIEYKIYVKGEVKKASLEDIKRLSQNQQRVAA